MRYFLFFAIQYLVLFLFFFLFLCLLKQPTTRKSFFLTIQLFLFLNTLLFTSCLPLIYLYFTSYLIFHFKKPAQHVLSFHRIQI